jgi:hypothetical protein
MNCRKERGELAPHECKTLSHAWIEAARLGRPLNRFLTMKTGGDLSPLDHVELVDRTWNKLGGWSRYHSGGFYCLLVREKERGGAEHFHVLIHVPPSKASLFDRTVRGWFDEIDDIDIRPAHQRVTTMGGGKRGSALGYVTKQRTTQAAHRTSFLRRSKDRRGDYVLGKRARISMTLRAYVPPTPNSRGKPDISPVVSIPAPPIQSEAA